MTRQRLFVALACVVLSACNQSAPVPEAGAPVETAAVPDGPVINDGGDYVISDPVRHANLTIFPVLSKTLRLENSFITLEEGLKAGTVEIRELGARARGAQAQTAPPTGDQSESREVASADGNAAADEVDVSDLLGAADDVSRLTLVNRGDKPLYLMPGEIIVGGSQDRTIAEEMVIAATGEPVTIDVYCVESGRWGARDLETTSAVLGEVAEDSVDADLAATANTGKFVAKAGNLSKASRLAVQSAEGQHKVWDAVARANSGSGADWASGAFTANYVDPRIVERLKPYVEALAGVSDQERIVGIVVAINGKLETVDVFGSTPLFRKLWPQLLKSFALDALEAAETDEAGKTSTPDEATAFLASVLRDQGEEKKTEGGLVVSRHETKDAVSFHAGGPMGGMGTGMGGFGGGPIHSSGYSK